MKHLSILVFLILLFPLNLSAQSQDADFVSGVTITMVLASGAVSGGLTTTQLTKNDKKKEERKVRRITLFLKRNHVAFLANLQLGSGQLFNDFYRLLELNADKHLRVGKHLREKRGLVEPFVLDPNLKKTAQLIAWIETRKSL